MSIKKKILVVAPHPDDETLGCGGTLLRAKNEGHLLYWVIVTQWTEKFIPSPDRRLKRDAEVDEVAKVYGFEKTFQLGFPVIELDQVPTSVLVQKLSDVFREVEPQEVYLPFRGDVHSDHAITFDAALACTKWFRYPSVKRVFNYEVPSETEFGISPESKGFRPNFFVDISRYLEDKVRIMEMFSGEMGKFPFPRSVETLRALARFRGSSSGFEGAEAFILLNERR